MKHYKTKNKILIKRDPSGKFAKWTLEDFGAQSSTGKRWCKNCQHGWYPLVETGYCPECQCQEKLTDNECAALGLLVVTEIKVNVSYDINPFTLNKLATGAKFEAEIVDDCHVVLKEFNVTMYVVGGSFHDHYFKIPDNRQGYVYLKDRWFYFSV
jgi:hypothetical protein